ATQPVVVEQRLFELFTFAQRIHHDTDGAFDISVGALIKAWGFFRRAGHVPSDAERAEVQTKVGMGNVILNPDDCTIRFLKPGLELNLGSIGKGYALDRVAELLRRDWNAGSVLVHGGCSSVYALGSGPGERHGWRVGVRHPWRPERRLAVLRLRNR